MNHGLHEFCVRSSARFTMPARSGVTGGQRAAPVKP